MLRRPLEPKVSGYGALPLSAHGALRGFGHAEMVGQHPAGRGAKDTAEIVEWLRKTQYGRRLVPHKAYRKDRFAQEPTPT